MSKTELTLAAAVALLTAGQLYQLVDDKPVQVVVGPDVSTATEVKDAAVTSGITASATKAGAPPVVTCGPMVDEKRGPGVFCSGGTAGWWIDEATAEKLSAAEKPVRVTVSGGKVYTETAEAVAAEKAK